LELAKASRKAVGGARQHLGDLGVDLQRAVDLAEALRGCFAELLHELRQPVDVGAHTRLHLAEALVDELLATGQRGVAGLGVGSELLAAHRDGVLDREHCRLTDDIGRDR
jgi:hypothetical protein